MWKKKRLKIVLYIADDTRKQKGHINVEPTQGGGVVAFLMKYSFTIKDRCADLGASGRTSTNQKSGAG